MVPGSSDRTVSRKMPPSSRLRGGRVVNANVFVGQSLGHSDDLSGTELSRAEPADLQLRLEVRRHSSPRTSGKDRAAGFDAL